MSAERSSCPSRGASTPTKACSRSFATGSRRKTFALSTDEQRERRAGGSARTVSRGPQAAGNGDANKRERVPEADSSAFYDLNIRCGAPEPAEAKGQRGDRESAHEADPLQHDDSQRRCGGRSASRAPGHRQPVAPSRFPAAVERAGHFRRRLADHPDRVAHGAHTGCRSQARSTSACSPSR